MSLPRFFYASRLTVRRWVAGEYFPGIYFVNPSGRARVVLPLGRRVPSVYGASRARR